MPTLSAREDLSQALPPRLSFGRFELQPHERRLLVDGEPAALKARAFDVLLALVQRAGQLVTKNQLLETVWRGVVVEEGNLSVHVYSLRKVLGVDVIATIPGRGYRFTASVDIAGASAASVTQPPATTEPALRTNLPERLPSLLGRDDDLAALTVLVATHPLVTVVGAGGIGKTRLAQALLHAQRDDRTAWPHGVCWVELATGTDAAALPSAVAAAVGVRPGSGEALAGLCRAVAPLQMLLALDNAEHLLEGVAQLVQALLDAAPGVRLIVTSQAPLKVAAERVYRLESLAVPQGPLPAQAARDFGAVALFVERAQAADARFILTDDNAPAVIELCRALDGLALAIELAAARAPMLGVQRLARSMHDRLKLLTTSRDRSAPARQQTLRAALEWSHGFLDERERAVFRRLAVFAGSGSLTMIQQVVADPAGELDEWAVLDALEVLVDRSLVAVVPGSNDAEPRYRLLDSPRVYARERLKEAGEEDALRTRHAHGVAAAFEIAYERFFDGSIGVFDWQDQTSLDLDNAREAITWARAQGDTLTGLRIIPAMLRALPAGAESLTLVDLALPLVTADVPLHVQARVLWAGFSLYASIDPRRSWLMVERAVEAARALRALQGDEKTLYMALCDYARTAAVLGKQEIARACLNEARALEHPDWPPALLLFGAGAEGVIWHSDPDKCLSACRRARDLGRAGGGAPFAVSNLMDAELAAGNAAEAARLGTQHLAESVHSRQELATIFVRANTLAAWLAMNDCMQARAVAQPGWAKAPHFRMQYTFADYLALLAALEGRPRCAARLVGYADACWAALGVERQLNENAALERAVAQARPPLVEAEFDRLRAEGRALRDDEIAGLAFATEDSA